MSFINSIKIIILISFFYSFGFTLLAYSISDINNINELQEYDETIKSLEIQNKFENTLNTFRSGIPLINIAGGIILFTKDILLDLFVNFVLAIPSLVTLAVNLLLSLLNLDVVFQQQISIFIFGILSTFYILSLILVIIQIISGNRIEGVV